MIFSKQTIATVLLAIVGFALFFSHQFSEGTPAYSDESPSFNRQYWEERIRANGANGAYQEFVEKNSAAPFEREHVAAHVIGELLFEHEGAAGITFCDAQFGFGCYHGFFSRAITAEGAAIIPQLDEVCVAVYGPLGTGCQHGIGHGIMEYVGYDNIGDALTLCKETTQLTTLLGCTSGVFMEYNTPLAGTGSDEAPQSRAFDVNRPYTPCASVATSFKESCYFELGQWFAITFTGDYATQRTLCAGVAETQYRNRCFMGVGALAAPVLGYDVDRVRDVCAHMGDSGALLCRAGASWSFYADPSVRSSATALCASSDVVQQGTCLTLADLTEGLRQESAP